MFNNPVLMSTKAADFLDDVFLALAGSQLEDWLLGYLGEGQLAIGLGVVALLWSGRAWLWNRVTNLFHTGIAKPAEIDSKPAQSLHRKKTLCDTSKPKRRKKKNRKGSRKRRK